MSGPPAGIATLPGSESGADSAAKQAVIRARIDRLEHPPNQLRITTAKQQGPHHRSARPCTPSASDQQLKKKTHSGMRKAP